MPNRLAHETSPYLLQHADNPVDWRPWGPEAFAEARERDVPVLLSVGRIAVEKNLEAFLVLDVPGTKVVYPSTVLMLAVPARVAGVEELAMVTPAAADGAVSPLKLGAADSAGVDRGVRAGGCWLVEANAA